MPVGLLVHLPLGTPAECLLPGIEITFLQIGAVKKDISCDSDLF
jgi:hypothetical protein